MIICRTCFQPFQGMSCPYCEVRMRQFVGQMPADSSGVTPAMYSPSSTPPIVQASSSAPVAPGAPGAGVVQPASWDDLQLLYPFLWPDWAMDKGKQWLLKKIDPSQEQDPQVKRNQLGAIAQQLNNVVKTCTSLPSTDVQNWNLFAQQFIPWFEKNPNFYDPNTDNDQAALFQDQLRGWQTEIGKYCNLAMPLLPKATPTLSQLGEDFLMDVGKAFDTIKFLVALGAGLFLVSVAIIGVDNTRRIVLKALSLKAGV